jgi:hypothetical protein
LPTGFDVHDDPTADMSLASAYEYDDEGEKAQAVELVVDGVIRTHYASRTPSNEVKVSNGHGRGSPGNLVRGGASWTTLDARKGTSRKKLHKLALAQSAAYELDHYIVVRRLEDPAVARAASAIRFSMGGSAGLPAPMLAYRVYADGREEPVRGMQFVGADYRLLRDLVAAGTRSHTTTLLQPAAGDPFGGVTGGLPTTISTADLLFAEVELSSGEQEGEKPPALPSPLAKQ